MGLGRSFKQQMSKHSGRRALGSAAAVAGIGASIMASGPAAGAAPAGYHSAGNVAVGQHPEAVAVDQADGTAYVSNQNDFGGTVSVVNEAKKSVATTIQLGRGTSPDGVAVDPNTRTVFVADTTNNRVSMIDTASHGVRGSIPVGSNPGGIAVDSKTGRVYVTTEHGVAVINEATRAVVATVPVAHIINSSDDIGVDPNKGRVYVGTTSGVAEIKESTNAVAATVRVGKAMGGIAVDSATGTVYSSHDGTEAVIPESANKVTKTITGVAGAYADAADPASKTMFVGGSKGLSVINEATNTVSGTAAGTPANSITANPATGTVYAVNSLEGTVTLYQA